MNISGSFRFLSEYVWSQLFRFGLIAWSCVVCDDIIPPPGSKLDGTFGRSRSGCIEIRILHTAVSLCACVVVVDSAYWLGVAKYRRETLTVQCVVENARRGSTSCFAPMSPIDLARRSEATSCWRRKQASLVLCFVFFFRRPLAFTIACSTTQ